ncbi:MAG TPA: hypothetical protein VH880_01340 [Anaeromyxobacteraceae bacterium]|jgi:hypothetical protein
MDTTLSRLAAAGAALALGALLAPSPAQAQSAARHGEGDDDATEVRAAVDPATGTLRAPTHEEAAELSRQRAGSRAASRQATRVMVGAGGAVGAELDESFDSQFLARVRDGKVETSCTDSPEDAKAFLSGAAPATSGPARPALEEE